MTSLHELTEKASSLPDRFRLDGKVALVVGGSRGLDRPWPWPSALQERASASSDETWWTFRRQPRRFRISKNGQVCFL